jgi:hypothetical protein
MKHHWDIDPLPPPEESRDSPEGFFSFALLMFVIIGPLVYFGPELRVVETWMVDVHLTIERWFAPIRNMFAG